MRPQRTETSSRRKPRSVLALAVWLGFAGIFIAAAFYGRSAGTVPEDAFYDSDLAVSGGLFYGLIVGLSFAVAAFFRRPRRALGFRRFSLRWLWIALGVVVLSIIVSLVLEPVLHAGEEQGFAPSAWEPEHAEAFAANAVVTVGVGPFAEELFFRGLGVRVLGILGGAGAILVSAIIFGLVHGLFVALPSLVFFGLGLGWIRLRSGSVWPGFLAHALYNGVGIALLVLTWILDLPTPQ